MRRAPRLSGTTRRELETVMGVDDWVLPETPVSGNCVRESFKKTPTLPCRVDCEGWVRPGRLKVILDDQTWRKCRVPILRHL